GSGDKAFVYLGRYLYRGVIQEKDILKCTETEVTFRYKDSKTKRYKTRTLLGVAFIRLILQHVLPRRFRRAREYGLLHPNSKNVIKKLHVLLKFYFVPWKARRTPRAPIKCSGCGGVMKIVQTRIEPIRRLFELYQSAIADGGLS
ncbi:MAG: transposase, partial [Thiomicrorhabdus sp.]|nr:transposase [Thiomicrorhabdus sp.]